MRSAAAFQLVTVPSSVFAMTASLEDSTMAAWSARARSTLRCSVTSWKTRTTPVVDGGAAVFDGQLRPVAREQHRVVGEADDLPLAQDLIDRALHGPARDLV